MEKKKACIKPQISEWLYMPFTVKSPKRQNVFSPITYRFTPN